MALFRVHLCVWVCVCARVFISNADHEAVLFSELSDIWPGSEPVGVTGWRGMRSGGEREGWCLVGREESGWGEG